MNRTYSNKKFIIDTNQAPRAIGPYSQGISFGGLVFVSGQIPVDPQSGEIAMGGIEAQTRQVMNNLQAVLMAAGLDFSHVLKTTVFLRNMNDYSLMNDVYGLYFDYSPPARACVEVSRLPKDVLVEVECIAAAPTDYEDRVGGAVDTEADHGTPDQWEAEHIAAAQATHATIPNKLAPKARAEAALSGDDHELGHEPSEVEVLDALDALQEGDDREAEELDESSVIEEEDDPRTVPPAPKTPPLVAASAGPRPAPPRIAKLKLPKRDKIAGDSESESESEAEAPVEET